MIGDPLEMGRRATKKAFAQINRVTGTQTDPDLRMYESLKPEHFQALMQKYGEKDIVDYIRVMESRRIMAKRGG